MNQYIKNNPSNHSKQGEAVERELKIRWLLKNILAFIGCIVLLFLLNQVVDEWQNNIAVAFVFSVFMLILFLVSSTSLLRAINEYRS